MSNCSLPHRFYAEHRVRAQRSRSSDFSSPEKLKRHGVNQGFLHRTHRTLAAASSEEFLLKQAVAVLLFSFFLPLEGKIHAWYVAVGTLEERGSKKKALWFLTCFISAWQREKWPSCVTRGNLF